MHTIEHPRVPRGLTVGTVAALAVAWGPFLAFPGSSAVPPLVQTIIYFALFVVTICSRRVKVVMTRTFQRYTINPLMRLFLVIGVNPLGLMILETRGRVSGRRRRTPVGNGRVGEQAWVIAEHGNRSNYVRNILHDPRVRVRLRRGLRYRWIDGRATVLPSDDALARQRQIIRWHPLRALNAMNVRVMGADLLTVHIQLLPDRAPSATTQSNEAIDGRVTGDETSQPVG